MQLGSKNVYYSCEWMYLPLKNYNNEKLRKPQCIWTPRKDKGVVQNWEANKQEALTKALLWAMWVRY